MLQFLQQRREMGTVLYFIQNQPFPSCKVWQLVESVSNLVPLNLSALLFVIYRDLIYHQHNRKYEVHFSFHKDCYSKTILTQIGVGHLAESSTATKAQVIAGLCWVIISMLNSKIGLISVFVCDKPIVVSGGTRKVNRIVP